MNKLIAVALVTCLTLAWITSRSPVNQTVKQAIVSGKGLAVRACSPLTVLDSVPPGVEANGSLIVENRGTSVFNIRASSSCNCSELSPKTCALKPKEKVAFSVKLRRMLRGETHSTFITLQSDDPELPEYKHQFRVRCPDICRVSPSAVDFGRVKFGETRAMTLTIEEDPDGPPFRPDNFDIRSELPSVVVTSTRVDQRILCKVSWNPEKDSAVAGSLKVVPLDSQDDAISVSVSGQIVETLIASPRHLTLDFNGSAWEGNVILVRTDGQLLGPVTAHSPGLQLTEVTRTRHQAVLRLRFAERPPTETELTSGDFVTKVLLSAK